jgi:uncharacterized membrane protein
MPINSAPVLVDAKDLIQINATMLTGILIFYTIPYITRGWKTVKTIVYVRGPAKVEKKYKPVTENAVLTLIAVAIVLFIVSTILAFVAIFPLPISYWFSTGGFVAIGAAAIIFIKVIQKVKEQTSEEKAIEQQAKAVEREMMEREKALQSPFEPDPNPALILEPESIICKKIILMPLV